MMNHEEGLEIKLRELIEQFMLNIELHRYDLLSEIGARICTQLVELLDSEAERSTGDGGHPPVDSIDLKRRLVAAINNKIRQLCQLAVAYTGVLEFVRLKDLICLSKLVGKIQDPICFDDHLDFDRLLRILRQSIVVLKFLNVNTLSLHDESFDHGWLSGKVFKQPNGVNFPKYVITNERLENEAEQFNIEILCKSLEQNGDNNSPLEALVSTSWFNEFLNRNLMKPLALDRFTVLVAVWIVGWECRHSTLCQLIAHLVDEIHHQEINTNHKDELMQLTQVGSFWLSYHKKYRSTIKQMNTDEQLNPYGLNSFEEDDDESNSMDSLTSIELQTVKNLDGANTQTNDLRLKLRQIIDKELIHGDGCPMCGQQANELLGSLSRGPYCNNCGLETGQEFRCGISFQPMKLLNLRWILRLEALAADKLVLISPAEWLRETLKGNGMRPNGLKLDKTGCQDSDEEEGQVHEEVDISDNFERLTVIRPQRALSSDSNSSDGSDSDHDDERPKAQASPLDDSLSLLRLFLKQDRHIPSQAKLSNSESSESLQLLRFVAFSAGRRIQSVKSIPIFWSDLLLLDTRGSDIEIVLATTRNRLLRETGGIWCCTNRSPISQLSLGCGQLFSSLELIRLERTKFMDHFRCPHCGQPLNELLPFISTLRAIS